MKEMFKTFKPFIFVCPPWTKSGFVPHWAHTELAVAVMLSLLFLLPALTQAEGIVCEVGLCGEGGKQRTGRRDEKKRERQSAVPAPSQTLIPASLERMRLSLQNPGVAFLSRGLEEVAYKTGSHQCYSFHLNYTFGTGFASV